MENHYWPEADQRWTVPLAMGAPTSDPWGSDYGYCVWDVGTISAAAGCGGATGRLDGADNPVSGDARTLTVMAVISSGPDRQFQTTCNAYVNASTDLISVGAGSDDLFQRYTYAEAAAGGGGEGLWFLKSGDPTTATIDRSIEIGGSGLVQATAVTTTGKVIAGDGLRVGDESSVANGECDDSQKGLIRYNNAGSSIEFCAGTAGGWVPAGGGSIDSLSDAMASASLVNIALGTNAAAAITTGKYNTAVGQNTLQAVTTGEGNLAIGAGDPAAGGPLFGGALGKLTTGSQNIAIGPTALANQTTASGNLAIGYGAGAGLTTGTTNVSIGNGSMIYAGNLSEYNTAVGHQALQGNFANLTAGYNTAVGGNALRRASSAANNVMVGVDAGQNITTGSQNTAVGMWALNDQTTISRNTAIGFASLYANTSGTPNTAIGSYTLQSNTTGSRNIAIGGGEADINPNGPALRNNTTGNNNIGIGVTALAANTTGSGNIAIGRNAGNTITTSSGNIMIGIAANPSVSTGSILNIGDTIYGDLATDKIGIGTTSPVTALDINGGVRMGFESASCTASLKGTIRFIAASNDYEFCDGSAWVPFERAASGGWAPNCSDYSSTVGLANVVSQADISTTVYLAGARVALNLLASSYLDNSVLFDSPTKIITACATGGGSPGLGYSVGPEAGSQIAITPTLYRPRVFVTSPSVSGSSNTGSVTFGTHASASINYTVTLQTPGSYLFRTSTIFLPGTIGSLANADAICTTRGRASTVIPGASSMNFKAVISDSTTDAKDRITVAYPVVDLSGAIVSTANLFSSRLTGVQYDEFGAISNNSAWTGSTDAGLKVASTCNDWTTSVSGPSGRRGISTSSTSWWLDWSDWPCSFTAGLICISQ